MPSATDRQVLKLVPGGAPRGNERYAPFAVLRVLRPLPDLRQARPGDRVHLDTGCPTPVMLHRTLPVRYDWVREALQAGQLAARELAGVEDPDAFLERLAGAVGRGQRPRSRLFLVLAVQAHLPHLGHAGPGDTLVLDPSNGHPVVLHRALPADYGRLWEELQAGNLEAVNLGAEALVAALAEEAAARVRLESSMLRRRGARKGGQCA